MSFLKVHHFSCTSQPSMNLPWTMPFSPSLAGILGYITLYLSFVLVRRYWRLRHVRGPFLASLTDLWRFRLQYNGSIQPILYQLHKKYGPIVRIGPNTVSVSEPEYITPVFGARGGFTKSDSYGALRTYIDHTTGSIGSIIDIQDEKKVKAIKRAIGTVFLANNMLDYEPDIDLTISNLGQSLQRRMPNGTRTTAPFNLYEMVQHFQLDLLLRIAFGEDAGCLSNGRDVLGLAGLTYRRLQHWYSWQAVPGLERFIFQNWWWSGWLLGYGANKSRWAREGAARVERRRTAMKDGKQMDGGDLLDKYFAASEKHPQAVPPKLMFNLVNSTIAAGTDTTVGTVTVLFYFLLKNPEVRERLLDELQQAGVVSGSGCPVRYVHVNGLPYLDAVIKETLRLLAVLGTPLERTAPAEGGTLGSVYLPGGTVVGCSPYVVHRHEATFGAQVKEFKPERWLVDSLERRVAMEHATLSWSHGSRTCLGRNLAVMIMKKLVPTILLAYEFELCVSGLEIKFGRGILESEENPIMVTAMMKDQGQ